MSDSQQLPDVIPVFPLTGSLLLPGNWLPLHVFEARYRHMVEDSMAGHKVIGMIQPVEPREDNAPADEAGGENPPLYSVGCAGHIEQCEELEGGRFAIALKGVSRFRVRREVELEKGYRRVEADYSEFAQDLETPAMETAPEEVLDALRAFGDRAGVAFELEKLESLPAPVLVNGLAMAMPFKPAEKQALLEAESSDRARILLTLLEMGVDLKDPGPVEPVLN